MKIMGQPIIQMGGPLRINRPPMKKTHLKPSKSRKRLFQSHLLEFRGPAK